MNCEEFALAQQEWTRPALSSLLSRCYGRYLTAADLVNLGGEVPERIRRAKVNGGTSLQPLVPAWDRICERYRNERYDPQVGLFRGHENEVLERWGQFVYGELFPALVREHEFVRNVLRAVELLPCHSPGKAAAALVHCISEMYLPNGIPISDPEDID